MPLTVFRSKICIVLTMILLLAAPTAKSQEKNYFRDFIFKWNASFGVAVPFNFYQNKSFNNTLYHDFKDISGSGLIYTISKPLGNNILLGVEIQDISLKGNTSTQSLQEGIPATEKSFFTRFLNTNLSLQYNFFQEYFIYPYLFVKGGTSKITTRLNEYRPDADQQAGFRNTYNKENLSNIDKLFFSYGAGLTMQIHPLLSLNVFGEHSKMPVNYVNALPDSRDNVRFSNLKDHAGFNRMVITLTSYSDFSDIFGNKGVNFNRKYKLYRFFPFYDNRPKRKR